MWSAGLQGLASVLPTDHPLAILLLRPSAPDTLTVCLFFRSYWVPKDHKAKLSKQTDGRIRKVLRMLKSLQTYWFPLSPEGKKKSSV